MGGPFDALFTRSDPQTQKEFEARIQESDKFYAERKANLLDARLECENRWKMCVAAIQSGEGVPKDCDIRALALMTFRVAGITEDMVNDTTHFVCIGGTVEETHKADILDKAEKIANKISGRAYTLQKITTEVDHAIIKRNAHWNKARGFDTTPECADYHTGHVSLLANAWLDFSTHIHTAAHLVAGLALIYSKKVIKEKWRQ